MGTSLLALAKSVYHLGILSIHLVKECVHLTVSLGMGHLHDDVILLLRPESFSVFLSFAN